MAGLLDFLDTPAGQGLLAAGFGALAGRGSRTQALGQGGLLGLQAYAGAQDQIEQRKKQAVAEQMQQMQLQQMQQQMTQQQQKGNYLQSVGKVTSPVVGAQPNRFDPMKYIGMGGSAQEAQALANVGNWGKAAVKDYKEVRTPDGGVQIVGFDEYGNQVKTGATPFKAAEVRDFGGYVGGIDPITGKVQQYGAKTMSASERDASARGWANVGLQREANNIQKQAARTQVVEGADGNVYLVDKGTGLSRPAATMGGTNVMAGKFAEQKIARQRDANDVIEILDMAGPLLEKATGSGIGAARDATARFVGASTEGAQAAAKLEALGGTLVMKMPRMEGPQSNYDQMLYREMAGKIGDRTVPAAEKKAAMDVVRSLQQKYTGQKSAPAGGVKFLGFE